MVITKSGDVVKQGFCKMLSRKLSLREGPIIISYLSLCGREWGGAGRLFEAGRLLTFLPLGWALIRGCALIRINTVLNLSVEHFWHFVIDQQERIW